MHAQGERANSTRTQTLIWTELIWHFRLKYFLVKWFSILIVASTCTVTSLTECIFRYFRQWPLKVAFISSTVYFSSLQRHVGYKMTHRSPSEDITTDCLHITTTDGNFELLSYLKELRYSPSPRGVSFHGYQSHWQPAHSRRKQVYNWIILDFLCLCKWKKVFVAVIGVGRMKHSPRLVELFIG